MTCTPQTLTTEERYQASLMEYKHRLGIDDPPIKNQIDSIRPSPWTLIDTTATLLSRYPATHYFTFTFATRISAARRDAAVTEWLDAAEWLQRRPLAWLWAEERSRWTGVGMPGTPFHEHGILFGAPHLEIRTAERLWRTSFGDALVERFEPGGRAIPYVLKQAFLHTQGDWHLGGRFDRLVPTLTSDRRDCSHEQPQASAIV